MRIWYLVYVSIFRHLRIFDKSIAERYGDVITVFGAPFTTKEGDRMKVINKLRELKRNIRMKSIQPYIDLSSDSIYRPGFRVDLRNPKKGKKYLVVGSHCVLNGDYIFETESGQIIIGDRVHIGESRFISREEIIIEDDVTIAWDCLFYDHNSHSIYWEERMHDTEQEYLDIQRGLTPIENKNWKVVRSAPIHICSKVWIGTGCKILKGVTIGEGAVVGAGSVVTKNVEAWTVVGGNPAQLLKKIKT